MSTQRRSGQRRFVAELKYLIQLLMDRPRSVKDLIEAMTDEYPSEKIGDAVRKRISRHLDWLQELGLASQRESKWYWYLSIRKFSSRAEYDLWMHHSRQLIPTLESIGRFQVPRHLKNHETFPRHQDIEIAQPVDPELADSARNHLKAYSDIDNMLTKVEEVDQKFSDSGQLVEGEILNRLSERFRSRLAKVPRPGNKLVDITTEPGKRVYVGDNVPYAIYKIAMSRLRGYPEPKLHLGSKGRIIAETLVIGRGEKLFKDVNSFVERESRWSQTRKLAKLEEEFDNAKTKLEVGIRWSITKKIDHGEPLMGHCLLCPNVKITN